MRCTNPQTVGFLSDGKTITWSHKKYSKEFSPFQLPCGKCISCRLEYARQTAVRCVHEASMYQDNAFVTLTYDSKSLKSDRLVYKDFQDFVKRLRNYQFQALLDKLFPDQTQKMQRESWKALTKETRKELYGKSKIGIFVAGEYGDRGKRPHWHALIFNWAPKDACHKYTNERGDRVYSSEILQGLWGHGIAEFGGITFESAGYCARYAAKKLVHGRDGEHEYNPISKRSTKSGIGRAWIEKYWSDVFSYGYVVLPDGIKMGVPRYYEKWFKKHHPDKWRHYVTNVKSKIILEAIERENKITLEEKKINLKRSGLKGLQISRNRARSKIIASKFDQLKKHLKI